MASKWLWVSVCAWMCLLGSTVHPATFAQLNALGVISVKESISGQPGAVGNGVADDTAAIQRAINKANLEAKIVLFPEGTYLVSNTLQCYKPNPDTDHRYNTHHLVGSTRSSQAGVTGRPVIKLKDNASGFTQTVNIASPTASKAVVRFARYYDTNGNRIWDASEDVNGGNSFFFNIRNLEFDLGSGNQGAVAVEFVGGGAQQCGMKDIKIRSNDTFFAGIRDFPGTASVSANIEVIGGRVGLYGSGQHAHCIAGVTLTNQTEYAYYNPTGQVVTLAGFRIVKPGAPAIRMASASNAYNGDIALVDGTIEFTGAPNGSAAVENPNGNGIYMHQVFVKNATTIIKSGSRAAIAGRSGWKRVTEYENPEMNTSLPGYNYIAGTQNALEYSTVADCNESDVPTDLVERHAWRRSDFPTPDDLYDRVHTDNDQTVAIGTENGMVADDTGVGVTADSVGPDNQAALQNIINSGKKFILIPKGKFLIKKNPSANYGVQLGTGTVLIGIASNISELRTHDDWNPTAEIPLLTTVSDAEATTKMADLKLGYVQDVLANDWFNSFNWKAGAKSLSRDIWIRYTGPAKSATQPRADMVFSGNGGGRHYGVHGAAPAARDNAANQFQRLRVENTTQPLAIYNANPEDALDKPQMLITGSSNVIFYGAKAEDRYGWGFKNSSNCAIIGVGGRAEVEFDNCTNSLATMVVHKQKTDPFNTPTLYVVGAAAMPKNAACGLFKVGTFDWSKVEMIPGDDPGDPGDPVHRSIIIEDFNAWPTTNVNFYNGSTSSTGETIQRSPATPAGSGFGWGAWTSAVDNAAQIGGGRVATVGSTGFPNLCFRPVTVVPGSYAYTIFDPAGGTNPDILDDLKNVILVTQQASAADAACSVGVRLLLRNLTGDWFLSTDAGKTTVVTDATQSRSYNINVATQSWQKIAAPAATDMNELDSDAGPGAMTFTTGTPDFAAITGGGVYVADTPSPGSGALRFKSITWNGSQSGTERHWLNYR